MSAPNPKPVPYRVSPSGRVIAELKALTKRAVAAGFGQEILDGLKKMERILRIYPQYGEPQRDLNMVGEILYTATFPPLYVEYIVNEPHRAVFIIVPVKAMPHVGFQ